MKLEGKTVIITSNSSVFFKLTKLLIENSGKPRDEFMVVAENGLSCKKRFQKRINKVGLINAFDEWLYTKYEAVFNHWTKAENKLLEDIEITSFIPDIITDTVNKSSVSILDLLIKFEAENIISIGSGFIPTRILKQFNLKINIHPGILPNYKGIGTPEAIMRGEHSFLGWSLHELATKIDSGRILYKKSIDFSFLLNITFAEVYIYLYHDAVNQIFGDVSCEISKTDSIEVNELNFNCFISIRKFTIFKIKKNLK